MSEIDLSPKATKLQKWILNKCEETYGSIGNIVFLRCRSCKKIVTANKVKDNGQCKCGHRHFNPTNLSLFEELYYVGRALWSKKPLQ